MKITSINIESSFTKFIDSQEIKIPSDKKTNCIFIYGKNGSGKSSISKLFYTNNKYIEGKEYIDDLLQLKTKRAIKDLNVKINFDNNTSNIFTGNSIINPIKIPVFNQEYIDYVESLDKTLVNGIGYTRYTNLNIITKKNGVYAPLGLSMLEFVSIPKKLDSSDINGVLEDNYDLLYGRLPKNKEELVLVVDKNNRILSIGYNGAPNGYSDDIFPWDREGNELETKYPYVVHAERNAILNYRGSRKDFEGAKIYVDLFPCNECAKAIIQSGIKRIVYLSDKYSDTEATIASKMMFKMAGVEFRPYEPGDRDIHLSL